MLENSDKMITRMDKDILSILSNQLYQTSTSHTQRFAQNIKKHSLVDTILGFVKATLQNLS